jgi:outer membrane protein OmpA-like peptidoglycan-associated protein
LLWYLFGRPGEQATQTTACAPANTPTSTASTTSTSPTAGTSANTQANSSLPSSLPSIPSLTIGGLDVGKQVNDSLGSLRTSLQGLTDKASASAALPHLQQVTTQLDKIGGPLGQATADQRKTIAGWFASLLPGLNQLFDKVLGMPDAANVLKPTIDGLRGKLASLNKQVSGATTQGAAAAQGAAPAHIASGYSFSAVKDGAAETLTLSGSLPDQAARQAMLAAAKRMFSTDRIVDNTEIKPGAPPEFGKTANSLLKELSRLGSGNAKITGTDAEISGSAFSDQAASAIKTALASLPGLHVKTDVATAPVTPVDPTDCQKLFKDLLDRAQIQFETGSSNIEADSTGLLDHLVGVARRCPSATFQVAGYTDSEGNADINMALSKRRAETVAKYLTSEGIKADRVAAAGFGASDPIASNDTEEGRAKNRRIVITTKEDTTTTKR